MIRDYVCDQYGSKRGLLEEGRYSFLFRLGYMRDLRQIDFTRVRRLVFVCSGNICRSPIGEYYAKHLGFEAESYGLHCRGGDLADPRSTRFCLDQLGVDLRDHRTRNVKLYTPFSSDLIVAMEPTQARELYSLGLSGQITLACLWADYPALYLHDPFSGNDKYFNRCARRLVTSVDGLVAKLSGGRGSTQDTEIKVG